MKALWLLLGAYTISWGFWLANPFWSAFSPRAGLYDQMADFMPEWAWGVHALLIGVAIIYGACCKWPRGIMWGHIAGVYHWTLISVLYAIGDWHNTGALAAGFTALAVHILWRESRRKHFVV